MQYLNIGPLESTTGDHIPEVPVKVDRDRPPQLNNDNKGSGCNCECTRRRKANRGEVVPPPYHGDTHSHSRYISAGLSIFHSRMDDLEPAWQHEPINGEQGVETRVENTEDMDVVPGDTVNYMGRSCNAFMAAQGVSPELADFLFQDYGRRSNGGTYTPNSIEGEHASLGTIDMTSSQALSMVSSASSTILHLTGGGVGTDLHFQPTPVAFIFRPLVLTHEADFCHNTDIGIQYPPDLADADLQDYDI